MKTVGAQCATLVFAVILGVSEGIFWPVSYSRDVLRAGSAFFDEPAQALHKIPSSQYDPRSKQFILVENDDCRPVRWHCLDQDISYCIAYDYLGNIAAIQFGYLKEVADQVDPQHYNFANTTNYKEKCWWNKPFYAVEIWLTDPEKLTEEGRKNLNEIMEGLWANVNGKWLRFDHRCQPIGPSIGEFHLQGCCPKMGTVFAYHLNKYSSCNDAFILYIFYDYRTLIGFGYAALGTFPSGPSRDWFDRPKGERLAQLFPSTPSCLASLVGKYGITLGTTFFIDEPWNINCPGCSCYGPNQA